MTDLKTPYLDGAIVDLEIKIETRKNGPVKELAENNLQEYQQIKAALKRLGELEEVFVLTVKEIQSRKENIISNAEIMPQPMVEGGVMAFDASIDALQETLKTVLEK